MEQSAKVWEDIQSGDYAAAQRTPFWGWIDKQARVLAILNPHHDDELKFEWPLIATSSTSASPPRPAGPSRSGLPCCRST